MKAGITVAELLHGLADVAEPLAGAEVTGLSLDSRSVQPGGAFVAVAGARAHGIDFAEQAQSRGARFVLFDPPLPAGQQARADWIAVQDLRAHLAELARRFFDSPSDTLRVIGVTGTNGKTSSVQLLAQALDLAGLGPCGHLGTLGIGMDGWGEDGERTTPDVLAVHAALDRLRGRGAHAVAMEVSSHALDQGRVEGVDFAVAAFTNLTRDHLDYHPSMEAYGEAKAQLFRRPGLPAAVINVDDAFGRALAASIEAPTELWTVSAAGDSDARMAATAISQHAHGLAFELREAGVSHAVQSGLIGRFNVDNLLLVASVLRTQGVSLQHCAEIVGRLHPVRGRMNRISPERATQGDAVAMNGPLVVVDYAHTPDALAQALSSLRAHTEGRLICVFGCGGERDAGKRPQMGAIAEEQADRVIVTDDNPRREDGDAIVEAIVAGCTRRDRIVVQRDRALAIRQAIAEAGPGDTVLIAGKGHETYQDIAGERRSFDDAAVARRCLEALT